MGYSILTDREANFRVMRNFLNQKEDRKHYTVQFPCCGGNVELKRPEDTYLVCPQCGKKYLLSHSPIANKLFGENK